MFRKRKQPSVKAVHVLTDKAANKIAAIISRMQNGFAGFMNKRTRRFTPAIWKTLIVVFALLWGGMSVHFISTAFSNDHKAQKGSTMKRNNQQMFITRSIHADSLRLMEMIYEKRNAEQQKYDPYQKQLLKDK